MHTKESYKDIIENDNKINPIIAKKMLSRLLLRTFIVDASGGVVVVDVDVVYFFFFFLLRIIVFLNAMSSFSLSLSLSVMSRPTDDGNSENE